MDPVSHAVLGAALAEPVARSRQIVAAVPVGAVAAIAPDLDMLIRASADALLAVEYHRHFTHSLLFAPVGALLCGLAAYPFVRRWLPIGSCLIVALLGYSSHVLLDACTSFGTLLYWPFSRERVAFDVVSAIDPLFTLPLIGFTVWGLVRRRPVFAVVGLACAIAYLGIGGAQQARAEHAILVLATERGHSPSRIEAKPSFGNTLVWRTIYEESGTYYIDAVRTGIETRLFPGQAVPKLDVARDFPWLRTDTQQWRDVQRFLEFASGYLAVDDENRNRIVDIRYSLVPNRADAFWGIELDPGEGPEAHVAYVTMRLRSSAEGKELLRMLFQGDPSE
jgi:inner membrane protein